MLSMEAVLVCAMTDLPTTERLWEERQTEELIKTHGVFLGAYDRFERLFNEPTGLTKAHYDFQLSKLPNFLRSVEASRPAKNQGPGIGHWYPGVTLMVGEQINPRAAVSLYWPFVAAGGSSLWLAERLEEAKTNERDFYWINASEPDGGATDAAFVRKLMPQRIVALGAKANLWCKRNKLNCVELQHPQYWKRFRDGDAYPLIDALHQPQRNLFSDDV